MKHIINAKQFNCSRNLHRAIYSLIKTVFFAISSNWYSFKWENYFLVFIWNKISNDSKNVARLTPPFIILKKSAVIKVQQAHCLRLHFIEWTVFWNVFLYRQLIKISRRLVVWLRWFVFGCIYSNIDSFIRNNCVEEILFVCWYVQFDSWRTYYKKVFFFNNTKVVTK